MGKLFSLERAEEVFGFAGYSLDRAVEVQRSGDDQAILELHNALVIAGEEAVRRQDIAALEYMAIIIFSLLE
ncbi:MAG: hypothetical protein HN846_01275 [Candidatus Pacebacteria bacterium]|jgi:hypothetical protein|nr:hypothetical protein [Candidatus Paceibacterota bacterium]MBT3512084.1 hypothetical protein [Candidatus Paceibacterota bacterium]MBT4005212.1 hypothetical protein [Candidatus Paceibacterota bacterium]MBT4358578.1 hypothetical protein [Candidatus Paceibacterota bacterium]MBT4680671.1 hypothetical protein [Candidatus Paceibacterota bacterium]